MCQHPNSHEFGYKRPLSALGGTVPVSLLAASAWVPVAFQWVPAACWLAAVKAGLVVVPTMPLLRAAELKQIVDKAQVSAALCDSLLADELRHCTDASHPHHATALKQVLWFRSDDANGVEARMSKHAEAFEAYPTSRDDVCLIAFTSGTTGRSEEHTSELQSH